MRVKPKMKCNNGNKTTSRVFSSTQTNYKLEKHEFNKKGKKKTFLQVGPCGCLTDLPCSLWVHKQKYTSRGLGNRAPIKQTLVAHISLRRLFLACLISPWQHHCLCPVVVVLIGVWSKGLFMAFISTRITFFLTRYY